MWRVVHVTLSEEGCIRCGGSLEGIEEPVEFFPPRRHESLSGDATPPRAFAKLHLRTRRFPSEAERAERAERADYSPGTSTSSLLR